MSSEQRLNVSVEDGKYTVIMEANGHLHALRYGQPWQELSGNKLVYCLAAELEEARIRLAELTKEPIGYARKEDLEKFLGSTDNHRFIGLDTRWCWPNDGVSVPPEYLVPLYAAGQEVANG